MFSLCLGELTFETYCDGAYLLAYYVAVPAELPCDR
jgi:hypothetical protein